MSNDSKKATHKPTSLLILASGSPRRMELLKALISEFDQVVPAVDELDFHPKGPGDMVLENALRKAGKVATEFPSCWVIGADTTVAIGDKTFGKPDDEIAAFGMLPPFARIERAGNGLRRRVEVVTREFVARTDERRHFVFEHLAEIELVNDRETGRQPGRDRVILNHQGIIGHVMAIA